MHRRDFLSLTAAASLIETAVRPASSEPHSSEAQEIGAGVWKFSFGKPERITPVRTRHYAPSPNLGSLSAVAACPVNVTAAPSRSGYLVTIPLAPDEMVFGLGLQFMSFSQRGLKKLLRVNADPKMDTGDSHAPVPFYVTTRGYGVLIDTARYPTFYCGNKHRKESGTHSQESQNGGDAVKNALPAAYGKFGYGEQSSVLVEIPRAEGIDVYVFGGPGMREAIQRYNLYSGGGPLPPRWGGWAFGIAVPPNIHRTRCSGLPLSFVRVTCRATYSGWNRAGKRMLTHALMYGVSIFRIRAR